MMFDMDSLSHTPQDHAIMSLLALTMFADKQVLAKEIKAFSNAVIRLSRSEVLHSGYTETRAILWYESHKGDLKDSLKPEVFQIRISELLDSLKGFTRKQDLLTEMIQIANSDQDEHVSEKALTVIIARQWGLERWVMSKFQGSAAA